MQIRLARKEDLVAITEIYNHAIRNTVATFDTDEKTLAEQETWFAEHFVDGKFLYPIVVLDNIRQIDGFASLNRWSPRLAYRATAEISLYVRAEAQGKGYGSALLDRVLAEGKSAGIHSILSRITLGNDLSIQLHIKRGFKTVGIMHEVGTKFNRLLDVMLLEKIS